MYERRKSKKLRFYQILKLHIQVFADSELCVRYGLVKVCVQVMEHLYKQINRNRFSMILDKSQFFGLGFFGICGRK